MQNRINTFPTLALMPIGGSRRGESTFGQLFIAEVSVALQRNDTADLKKFRHKLIQLPHSAFNSLLLYLIHLKAWSCSIINLKYYGKSNHESC